MARIQTSSLISDIRGSVGGVTFQMSSHGLIAAKRKQPTTPVSFLNTYRNLVLSRLNITWSLLSEAQRESWTTFASYNSENTESFSLSKLSGLQTFMRTNFYLAFNNLALLLDPSYDYHTLNLEGFSFHRDEGLLLCTLPHVESMEIGFPVLFLYPPTRPTVDPYSSQPSLLQTSLYGPTVFQFNPPGEAYTGPEFSTNKTYYVELVLVSSLSGYASPRLKTSFLLI